MTGKFHTDWGIFIPSRTRALEFECFRMRPWAPAAASATASPRRRAVPQVYDLVGKVYSQVEAVEPWCRGARR
jgi:hypothetical protein